MSRADLDRVSRAANRRFATPIPVSTDDTFTRREVRDLGLCGLLIGAFIGLVIGYAWAYSVTAAPKFAEYALQHQTAERDPLLGAR